MTKIEYIEVFCKFLTNIYVFLICKYKLFIDHGINLTMKLYSYFKERNLESKIGNFKLIYDGVKSGGNSNVLFFEHALSKKQFAVKFLTEWSISKKTKRFIDEYFSLIQLPPHKNIVRQYHLDSFLYQESADQEPIEIFYIVMKRYSSTLKDNFEEKNISGIDLLKQLCNGMNHLHKFGVIHRDIKPENIFYDDDLKEYVIGDFGIAHFNEEFVAKLSHTERGDRLANFSFSPEELMKSGENVSEASDIYSLGQVIQWFHTGNASKGAGRPTFGDLNDIETFALNQIVNTCIQSDINKRFQTISVLYEEYKKIISPKKRDLYARCYDLDKLFRSSFPTIRNIYETENKIEIDRFIRNLSILKEDEFDYMNLEGGDTVFRSLDYIENDLFLINEKEEISIKKIIAYSHDSRLYNNFFILLTNRLEPFNHFDTNGEQVIRTIHPEADSDYATLYNGKYMDSMLFESGYIEIDNNVIKLNRDDYSSRTRSLCSYAYIIYPQMSGPNLVMDRTIVTDMLENVLSIGCLDANVLREYQAKINKHHSYEFRKWD